MYRDAARRRYPADRPPTDRTRSIMNRVTLSLRPGILAFLAFIPLPFHPENTVFQRRGWRFSTGNDDLKMIAASRLMLDNIPNIKAYWIMISTPLAQIALHFGANDIQGTVMEEQIAHAAGAVTPQEERIADLVSLIREAGRVPVQRDTLYNTVRTF